MTIPQTPPTVQKPEIKQKDKSTLVIKKTPTQSTSFIELFRDFSARLVKGLPPNNSNNFLTELVKTGPCPGVTNSQTWPTSFSSETSNRQASYWPNTRLLLAVSNKLNG